MSENEYPDDLLRDYTPKLTEVVKHALCQKIGADCFSFFPL